MNIVVDDKIPYIKEAIQLISSKVTYLPAKDFTNDKIQDADVLIIRTRIKCNESLLKGTRVKFIATATIGYDHIDTDYCLNHHIIWKNAPGCNAHSVQQYIYSSLLLLERSFFSSLKGKTIGIIGVGNVGSTLIEVAQHLGLTILLNDPLRNKIESDFQHVSLKELAEKSDIITFHVPLSRDGEYPTYHLANLSFFSSLKKKPIIINSSRGEVIDTNALKWALNNGVIKQAIIDVWENEPMIDQDLLQKVFIGTPHIAGYSADGKAMATQMALQAISDYYNLDLTIKINPPKPPIKNIYAKDYKSALLKIYNPLEESEKLKNNPELFEYFRGNYGLRREFSAFDIII